MVSSLKKSLDNDIQNEHFKKEFEKHRKKPIKKQIQISEVQKKIDSILKSPRISDKFTLKRSDCRSLPRDEDRVFVNTDEMKTKEAREMLENNKRKFGEHFPKNIIFTEDFRDKKHKKSLPKLSRKNSEDKHKILHISELRKSSGSVSQMLFPYIFKKPLVEEEKELLASIITEKKRITQRKSVQKYLIQRPLRV